MSISLPTGTVTFFFSDIEGSTRLVQRLGPGYRDVLGDHNEIVRTVLSAADATEVRTMGDSFFVAFRSASEAVDSAVRIQQDLEDHPWPDEASIRIRIGMHTGEGQLGGDDYVGVDVNRAARIADAGHGGQVLVSGATRAVVEIPDGMLRDLGAFRLKDLERPEHLFQVLVPGLPAEYPPPRTLNARPNNLPASATSLIGRDEDIAKVRALLGDHRVVTLLGPGGIGKTRLAIAAAAASLDLFADGVTFVDLSSIEDPELVPAAIAVALRVGESSSDAVASFLSERESLIVLDNFEQVVRAGNELSVLLSRAPRLKALITSQTPLGVNGEHRFVVGPLTSRHGTDSAGVRLFQARASAVDQNFAGDVSLVARIVDALDGLPLAVELAASRAHLLSLDDILARLPEPDFLRAATSQGPDRHRSLHDVLTWSHGLLGLSGQAAFRRLAVFAGGMTLAAAEKIVTGAPVTDPFESVSELIDRSFVNRQADGSGRLVMLDGVRRFAVERLTESGEDAAVAAAHTLWFCELGAEADRGLQIDRGELWRARLDTEHDNLRAVLSRLLGDGDADRGLELLGNIWRFMQSRGHLAELDSWLTRFFQLPGAAVSSVGRVKGLMARGALRYWQSDSLAAIADYRKAVELARRKSDKALRAEAMYGLATSLIIGHQQDEALPLLEEAKAIYRDLGDDGGRADVLTAELFYRIRKDGIAGLGSDFEKVVELYRDAGRMVQAAQGAYALVGVALAEQRYPAARRLALIGLDRAEELFDNYLLAWGLEWLAIAELELGEVERAGLLAGAGQRAVEAHGGGWSPEVVGLDDATSRLVSLLGEAEAEATIAKGRHLSLDEGLELARGVHDRDGTA